MFRLPQLKDPQGFYDIFLISILYVLVLFVMLELIESSTMRQISLTSAIPICLWVGWAVLRILGTQADEENMS